MSKKVRATRQMETWQRSLERWLAAIAILDELRDKQKATHTFLRSMDGVNCWEKMSEEEKNFGVGKMAVNDPAESSFGGVTRQLQCHGRINLTSATGVDQCKRNNLFSRGFELKNKEVKDQGTRQGMFIGMKEEMKQSLIEVSMEQAMSALL